MAPDLKAKSDFFIPGFVPISELSSKWEHAEVKETAVPTDSPGPDEAQAPEDPEVENEIEPVAEEPVAVADDDVIEVAPENLPGQVDEIEREPSQHSGTPEKEKTQPVTPVKLELEPISQPKKTNVLKKMNSRGSGLGSDTSKPSSSKSNNSSAGSRRRKS